MKKTKTFLLGVLLVSISSTFIFKCFEGKISLTNNNQNIDELFEAIQLNNQLRLSVLLKNTNNYDVRNSKGVSLVHAASRKNNCDIVEQLVKAGADVDTSDDLGTFPLLSSVFHDNYRLTKVLIEAGLTPTDVFQVGMAWDTRRLFLIKIK